MGEGGRRSRLRYLPRFILLLPLLAMMWVSSYNRIEPELAGIPFFYWYQILWVLIGAGLVLMVYLIETRIARRS
jgi:hypothetical protein